MIVVAVIAKSLWMLVAFFDVSIGHQSFPVVAAITIREGDRISFGVVSVCGFTETSTPSLLRLPGGHLFVIGFPGVGVCFGVGAFRLVRRDHVLSRMYTDL